MPSPLFQEIHALTVDGQVLITVQRWNSTLVVYRNGVRADRKTRRAAAAFAAAATALAATRVDDTAARAHLARLGVDVDYCPSDTCGEQLPVGGYRCVRCGTFPGRHGAGAMSGAARRPTIVFRFTR